jgi:hypothetical protein
VKRANLAVALSILTIASVVWAVPRGAAHRHFRESRSASGFAPVKLRDERDRGLLVDAWINGAGPFAFAVDTGSGTTIITRRVVESAKLRTVRSRRPLVGGLSTAPISSSDEVQFQQLALGYPENQLPSRSIAAVVPSLPRSLDGILDPTSAFSPLGYVVDLPNRELVAFDPKSDGLRLSDVPKDGAVVRWIHNDGDKPFVRLGDGRLTLIDTGSSFGLALNGGDINQSHRNPTARDLGGGVVQSKSVEPITVNIGALVLRRVPTDVLLGVAPDTPVILGRRALYPFKITFDPVARLIAFEPAERR